VLITLVDYVSAPYGSVDKCNASYNLIFVCMLIPLSLHNECCAKIVSPVIFLYFPAVVLQTFIKCTDVTVFESVYCVGELPVYMQVAAMMLGCLNIPN